MYRGYVLLMAPVYVLVVVVVVVAEPLVVETRLTPSLGMTTKVGLFGASPIHCAIRSVARVKKLVMYE